MALNIKIEDIHDLHKGFNLTLNPGFTAIVGPNGAGKTTLISQIKQYAHENNIKTWSYSNVTDGGETAMSRYVMNGDIHALASAWCASEGEKLIQNFANRINKMGTLIRKSVKDNSPLIILLDAIDSGLSINKTRELRDFIKMIETTDLNTEHQIYIIMAANQYELVKEPTDCVHARSGKHLTFKTYSKYANFICSFK